MHSILKIIEATHVDDYKLRLTFNNGVKKIIDFKPIAFSGKGITSKLKDMNYFQSFTLDPFTVDWNNEIAFAPEYLLSL